jgi:hypothetical protein
MGSNKILRSAHAFLGSALVSIFILHAGSAKWSRNCVFSFFASQTLHEGWARVFGFDTYKGGVQLGLSFPEK